MIDTRFERWAAQNAGLEAAGDNEVEQLAVLLRASGARVTFDSGRSARNPCTFCGRADKPRELVTLGRYVDGTDLARPVCGRCRPIADRRAMRPEAALLSMESVLVLVAAREVTGRAVTLDEIPGDSLVRAEVELAAEEALGPLPVAWQGQWTTLAELVALFEMGERR